MSKARAVLFDLDGVLVHSLEAWFQLVNLTARHFCKADVSRSTFEAGWGQGIDADLQTFFQGCNAEEIEAFYEAHLLDYNDRIEVMPDAVDTLQTLRQAEVPRGVITNTPLRLARDILAVVGLIGLVDVTVGAAPDLASKPAPDLLLRACDVLQVTPAEALVVGDSQFDVDAAKAAGCAFVGYRMGDGPSVSTLSEVVDLVDTETRT